MTLADYDTAFSLDVRSLVDMTIQTLPLLIQSKGNMINLSTIVPACFAQFDRIIELISSDPDDTQAGRQRYIHYREQGYTLHHETAQS